MDLSNKTACVIDNGLFVSFARMLGKEFKKVYYYTPWQGAFVQSKQLVIGEGFDEIERINNLFDRIDDIDLFIFTDLYHSDLQHFLESHGARVFGSRKGEEMELRRWDFKQYLKKVGLPVQHCEHFFGFEDLRSYLKKSKNKFVKTSFVRGDFETFRHDSYELSEPRLDDLEHYLGALKAEYEFIVEDEIPDAVEVGYDGFVVDGKFPDHAMQAVETKDAGMLGIVLPYDKLAAPVKLINEKLAPTFEGYHYRGFFCSEIRYTKKKESFLIDPCCRLGTPSNELLQELFDGWAETLWDGAEGKLTSPKQKAKFGCLAVIHSEYSVDNWQSLRYPKEIDQFVKLRFHTRVNDVDFIAPQVIGIPDLGCVVGTGSTLKEAIKQCETRAKQIKGFQVQVSLDSIDKGLEVVEKAKEFGLNLL
jgi:hypothetical protein